MTDIKGNNIKTLTKVQNVNTNFINKIKQKTYQ